MLPIRKAAKARTTIGGLIFAEIGHLPIVNDAILIHGYNFRVEKMAGRGVSVVSFTGSPEQVEIVKGLKQ